MCECESTTSNGFVVCKHCGIEMGRHFVTENPIAELDQIERPKQNHKVVSRNLFRALNAQPIYLSEYRKKSIIAQNVQIEKICTALNIPHLQKKIKEEFARYLSFIGYIDAQNNRASDFNHIICAIIYFCAILNGEYFPITNLLNEILLEFTKKAKGEIRRTIHKLLKMNNMTTLFQKRFKFQMIFAERLIMEKYTDKEIINFTRSIASKVKSIQNPVAAAISVALIVDYENGNVIDYTQIAERFDISAPTIRLHTKSIYSALKSQGIEIPSLYTNICRIGRKKMLEV